MAHVVKREVADIDGSMMASFAEMFLQLQPSNFSDGCLRDLEDWRVRV